MIIMIKRYLNSLTEANPLINYVELIFTLSHFKGNMYAFFNFLFQPRGKGAEAPNVNDEMSFPSLG